MNALIEDYLSQTRTVILAVIPSNQDIATVDILERARRVDLAASARSACYQARPHRAGNERR